MGHNFRQRQRRAKRASAVQSERTGTRLEQPVPCAFGDHKVSIALHPDGSLLSIHSECYDSPPSVEERAVVASLVGAEKFMTCADTVRHVLGRVGGGDEIEASPAYPDDPRALFSENRAYALSTLVSNMRSTRAGESPHIGKFHDEHRRAVLRALSQESSATDSKWLGHMAGVETRLRVHNVATESDKKPVWKIVAQARTVRGASFYTVALYLGKGRFKINRKAVTQASHSLTQGSSYRGSSCLVCARSFTSVKNHVQSERHRQRFESVVLDNLITLGSRLYRNQ